MTGYVDNNEGLIYDAVIRFLEEYTGHNRADLRRPELEGGPGGVDLLFNLDNLAEDPGYTEDSQELQDLLLSKLRKTGDLQLRPHTDVWENFPLSRGSMYPIPVTRP